MGEVTIERDIDLPPSIVREAFTDPILVSGWLRSIDELGGIEFALEGRPGGLRGTWTALTLHCPFAATEEWETSLDRLELLLKGHPSW